MKRVVESIGMKRLGLFGLVGTIGFLVDAGLLLALVRLGGLPPLFARVLSFIVAASVTFLLNQRFTFESGSSFSVRRWSGYLMAMTVGACLNLGAYHLWVSYHGEASIHLLIGTALGSLSGMFCNYYTSSSWVFRTPRTRPTAAE